MSKLSIAAGVALALAAGSALAADLPSRKGPPPAYMPPPPVFSWNGLYGGVNIGYGFGAGGNEAGAWNYPGFAVGGAWAGTNDINGVLGGGQIGYNYQVHPMFVVGVEADIQAADLNGQRTHFGAGFPAGHLGSISSAKSVDWFGTVRGRLGVTLPGWSNFLVYGTGGFAYGQVEHSVSLVDSFGFGGWALGRTSYFDTATGWTAGGGVEWSPMSFPAWSIKVEYLYTDLGNTNAGSVSYASTVPPFSFAHTSPTQFHTVRAGLNWHFNPFAAAPVLAKY